MSISTPIKLEKDGGLNENGVTSDPFTPANGSLIVVTASCYGATGDSAADLEIDDTLGLTWERVVSRARAEDGGAAAPPPAVAWMAEGTGLEMTVTTSKLNVTGFSHVQSVTGIQGHDTEDPIADVAEQTTTANGSLSLDTDVAGCYLIFHSVDINSSTIVPTPDANTAERYADARNDEIQSTFIGDRTVGAPGTYTIGTATPNSGTNINAIALAVRPAAAAAEVTLTPAVMTVQAQPLTPVPGPVTVALTPATMAIAAQPVTPVPQPVTVALTPAVLALAAVAVNPVPQAVTVNLTPAVLTFRAVPIAFASRPGRFTSAATTSRLTAAATTSLLTPGGSNA